MKTFLLDIADRFRRFDEQLDVKALLCNKSWQVFNDSGAKEIYIFQEDGSLIISLNGKVSKATWQYIQANHSLVINSDNESYMLHPFFQDENLFTLQLDGTHKYSFLLNEAQRDNFPVKTLTELQYYLEHKVRLMLQQKEREEQLRMLQIQQQAEQERLFAIRQREEELRKKKQREREERLQAFINENLSKDKYYLMLGRYAVICVMLFVISSIMLILVGVLVIFIENCMGKDMDTPIMERILMILVILMAIGLILGCFECLIEGEYRKKATKRLTEEFNRKYPEEDD